MIIGDHEVSISALSLVICLLHKYLLVDILEYDNYIIKFILLYIYFTLSIFIKFLVILGKCDDSDMFFVHHNFKTVVFQIKW